MASAKIISEKILPTLQDPLFQSWVSPLCAEAPCGEDVSFSDEFEFIKIEVEKCSSIHGGCSTDWDVVLRKVTHVLTCQSKDVWVLCYGIAAVYEVRGVVSCAAAISALARLLESYWECLHPGIKRIQRRLAPLMWISARLEARLAGSVRTEDKLALGALHREVGILQGILEARTGDRAPSFTGLLRLTGEEHAANAGPMQSRETAHTSRGEERAAIADDLLAAIDGDGRVPASVLPRLLRATQDQCRQLAIHYSSFDPCDWRVILMHRTALWGTVNQLPQADAAGVTQLRSVPLDRAQAYSAAVEARRYAEVLPQLEGSAGKAPFWLDGHFLVARCLEGINASGSLAILRAVLSQFLGRYPELLRYKYQDGTPFASPRTAQWLDSLESASSMSLPGRSTGGGEAAREQELLDEGLAIRAERGFQAGLSHLETVPAGRSRAAVRQALLLARYCIAAGSKKAAVRLLQALYAQLERWELLDWEPAFSAEVISLLISLQPKERGAGAEAMLTRLHWLHLGTATGSNKEM